MAYAIIALGGKQYRVSEGQRLLVDRLPYEEGATFTPDVLLLGGDGETKLGAEAAAAAVTVRVAGHELGKKVVVGKHRRRTGFRRRKGHRSRLSRIEIESIGAAKTTRRRAARTRAERPVEDSSANAETATSTEATPSGTPNANEAEGGS